MKITGSDKEEFYAFIESMANATYESFHLINASKSIEVIFSWENHKDIHLTQILFFFIQAEVKYQAWRLYDVDL